MKIKNFIVNYFLSLGTCVSIPFIFVLLPFPFSLINLIISKNAFSVISTIFQFAILYSFIITIFIHLISIIFKKNTHQNKNIVTLINITIIFLSIIFGIANKILFIIFPILIILIYNFSKFKPRKKSKKQSDLFINFFILIGANNFLFLLFNSISKIFPFPESDDYIFVSLFIFLFLIFNNLYNFLLSIVFTNFPKLIHPKFTQNKSNLVIFGLILGSVLFASFLLLLPLSIILFLPTTIILLLIFKAVLRD